MRTLLGLVVALGVWGCASGPAECEAQGGHCVLGDVMCFGAVPDNASELCNPDRNPGGAYCCIGMVCPPGESPADGGCT